MMRFIYTLIFFLGLFHTVSLDAQTGYSVADAITVDMNTSPIIFNNVNSENSTATASGMQGTCNQIFCCSMIVYKVIIPQEGSFYASMDNFPPLAGGMLLYSGPDNATTWSDLTYYPAAGNFCGFRDTVNIGRGYNRWVSTPYWHDKASYLYPNEYSIPAGTYYILFFNKNHQTTFGGGPSNVTFEFTPYCTDVQPEIEIAGNSVNILDGDDTPSDSDDTDFGTMLSGAVPISRTFTVINPSTNPLDISNATIVGDAAANFSITAPASTVPGGGSTAFTVEFTPNTIGKNNATVHIENTDCDRALFNFDLEAFVFGTSISDVRGNMLELDGSNQYVNIDNIATDMDGATSFTFEAWINADANQAGNDRIISVNTASGGNEILFYLDDGKLVTYDGAVDTYSSPELRGTGWHHVVLTHDNSNHRVYLDGKLLGTKSGGVAAFNSGHLWSIGQEYDGASAGDYFNGKMDEIRIWKDVRDINEIRENMHLTFSAEDIKDMENLVAYYQFDNDDVATTVDGVKDILGNHGTLINGGTYNDSEVAVGAGVSVTKNVITSGSHDFGDTGIELTFASGTSPNGDVVVTRIKSEAIKNGSAAEMANTLDEYWVINNYGTIVSFAGAPITMHLGDGFIDDDIAANHVLHKRGSNDFETVDWIDIVPNNVNSMIGNNYIESIISGFSQFYLSSNTSDFQPNVLPVELLYFNAKRLDNKTVQLDWETASETNNRGFEIERLDGNKGEFETIGWIDGYGTTTESIQYQYKDFNYYKGTSYYRLKQLDFDGRFEYSDIVAVHFGDNDEDHFGEFYPNPSHTGILNLDYNSMATKEISISLYDISGKSLYSEIKNVNEGMNQLNFDFSFLQEGIFFIKLDDGQGILTRKLMIK